ncbi:hypothetical protein P2318_09500 [Myxococcaceae bacterium GXIMD 01537]
MATMTRGAFVALACGLAGAGCGDTLVDERYLGTPRHSIVGSVIGDSVQVDFRNPDVSVALFWVTAESEGREELAEQVGTAQRAEYYRQFRLQLFDEPVESQFLMRRPGARWALGRVGAYKDANGNGRKDDSEALLGGSYLRVLVRAPQPLSAQDSPTGAPLEAGWHVVSTPMTCPSPPGTPPPPEDPPPIPTEDCGVPLGAPCNGSEECGGGMCMLEQGGPWPSGACVIPEPPPSGCRQKGSVLMRGRASSDRAHWIKACTRTEDCGRPAPYQCDQQLRGCKPSLEFAVELSDVDASRPFCGSRGGPPPQP